MIPIAAAPPSVSQLSPTMSVSAGLHAELRARRLEDPRVGLADAVLVRQIEGVDEPEQIVRGEHRSDVPAAVAHHADAYPARAQLGEDVPRVGIGLPPECARLEAVRELGEARRERRRAARAARATSAGGPRRSASRPLASSSGSPRAQPHRLPTRRRTPRRSSSCPDARPELGRERRRPGSCRRACARSRTTPRRRSSPRASY